MQTYFLRQTFLSEPRGVRTSRTRQSCVRGLRAEGSDAYAAVSVFINDEKDGVELFIAYPLFEMFEN